MSLIMLNSFRRLHHVDEAKLRGKHINTRNMAHNLLHVCRQLCNEALPTILKKAILYCCHMGSRLVSNKLPTIYIQNIRHLNIDSTSFGSDYIALAASRRPTPPLHRPSKPAQLADPCHPDLQLHKPTTRNHRSGPRQRSDQSQLHQDKLQKRQTCGATFAEDCQVRSSPSRPQQPPERLQAADILLHGRHERPGAAGRAWKCCCKSLTFDIRRDR